MKNEIRNDYRTAVDIQHALQGIRKPRSLIPVDESIEQCRRWQRRLEIAAHRDWPTAAKDAADRLRGSLDIMRMRAMHAIDELSRMSREQIEPTVTSIYRDIEGLRNQFERVTIDRANQRLTVETSSIVLEGVYLGSFEIRLNWKFMKESSPFDVIAVDPNPSTSSDGVTHPHVQGESLCEGEGADAIRRALNEGRLYDFFCVVDRVLRNYNPDSAYVQIEDWQGIRCKACDDVVEADEACCCSKCETELCSDCSTSCCGCMERYCSDCVSSCEGCGDETCQGCLTACEHCFETFCNQCLNEGTCDDCIRQQSEENAEIEVHQSSAAVHAVRDGKAAVSA